MLKDDASRLLTDDYEETTDDAEQSARTAERLRQAFASLPSLPQETLDDWERLHTALGSHVTGVVNTCLGALEISAPVELSSSSATLLLRAWRFSELLGSRDVNPFHLFAALLTAEKRVADALAEIEGVDRDWVLAGALIRQSVIEKVGDLQSVQTLVPDIRILEWIAEAGSVSKRNNAAEIEPMDFVVALRIGKKSTKESIRRLLRQTRSIGRIPAELTKTRHLADRVNMTVNFFRSETKKRLVRARVSLRSLNRELKTVNRTLDRMQKSPERSDVLERALASQRAHESLLNDVKSQLAAIDDRLARPPALSPPAQTQMTPLLDLSPVSTAITAQGDRITADIKRHLAPPSVGWLAASVLVVLALGVGAGLMMVP